MSNDTRKSNAFGNQSTTPKPNFGGQPNTGAPTPQKPGTVHNDAKPAPDNAASPSQSAEKTPAKKQASKPRRRTRTPQRTTLKIANEVIEVVRDVEAADSATRKLAATLFTLDNEVDAIAAAIATVDKDTVGVVSSLIELRDTEDALDRMVLVSTWDAKKTTTPAWRFLHALDLVSRQTPGNDTKTAAEFVRVLDDLPEELDLLLDLLN
ncbi:hypothetical protein GCM10009720_09360 [Yaniella flava]|uniref:Uncharacterized protein n=1 Tax=Yaniella flava TaxID=287930 RepID=A0ABN2U831_9MICC